MILFAFDYDFTVSTSKYAGPVPIHIIRSIAAKDNVECWAVGNQHLCKDAPAVKSMDEAWRRLGVDPPEDCRPTGEDAKEILENEDRLQHHLIAKRLRLIYLRKLFSEKDRRRFVVDDLEFNVAGWTHLFPQEFCDLALALK